MKTTNNLVLALAAILMWTAHPAAKGVEASGQFIVASVPSATIGNTDSSDSSKEAKIAALESRVAELEAMAKANDAKIAAIEKQVYPRTRVTLPRGRGPNPRR